ncbi:hypothetical protein L931_02445 [Helicobacter pylori PZ5024]|uniref:Uncharacterized protein n=1 Tax=Helicobacter pylori PZ5024 TaxID=1337391 RepID=T2T4T2_HELPX|nr:hypothetical protein L930_05530 [Helicobacter pylori PZ5004]EQD99608.1 hypothetical protein L931_02445 [Helicobacter pylori PZ5024]
MKRSLGVGIRFLTASLKISVKLFQWVLIGLKRVFLIPFIVFILVLF